MIRSAAAAQNDFLGGIPMRAGMVYGEARRVGGGGRRQPCGRSDGPAASRAASRGCAAPGRASVLPAPHRVPSKKKISSPKLRAVGLSAGCWSAATIAVSEI